MATLPAAVLTDLSFIQSISSIDRIRAIDEELNATGTALSKSLFEVIGALPEHAERPRLIGLRRALHQSRPPTAGEWSQSTAALLPVGMAEQVQAWTDGVRDLRRMRAELAEVLESERVMMLVRLREGLRQDEFRHALAKAGPTLLDELDKWQVDDVRPPQTQKIIRLARYASRAVAKTSPYSTFMVSGTGTWGSSERWVRIGQDDRRPRGVLDLDGGYTDAVRSALTGDPVLEQRMLVRANPSTTVSEGSVYLIGPPPAEAVVSLRLDAGVQACLQAVSSEALTLGQLRDRLAARSASADPAVIERFVRRLLSVGLLQTYVPVPEQSADTLAELAAWLRDGSTPAGELADLIQALDVELRREVPLAEVRAERARLRAVQAAMDRLAEHLDLGPAASTAALDTPVHETAVLPGPAGEADFARWQPALNDLDVVRRFLKVFDPKLAVQVAAGAFCRERFGARARVPLVLFYRAVQEVLGGLRPDPEPGFRPAAEDLAALLGPSAAPWSTRLEGCRSTRLHDLEALRTKAREAALPAPDQDGVVRVDPTALALHVQTWPSWVIQPTSVACYVQPIPGNRGGLVLNVVHCGHGRGRGRLHRQLARAGDPRPKRAAGRPPVAQVGVPVLAELGGLHGSSLNAREPEADFEIDYPFTVNGRPDSARLALGDLVVVHQEETDLVELHSARLSRRVMPLHLGMSSDFALAPVARFIERVFASSYLMHPSSPPLMALDDLADPDQPATAVRHPRVEVGAVVLQRARWFRRAADIPNRGNGRPNADYFLRLIDWLAEAGIPRHAYIRAWSTDRTGKQSKARKPMFIDFTNWFLVLDFERLVAASEFVVFDEALPDPMRSPASGAFGAVSEFLVELADGVDDV
jgi:hypothetical protein